MLCTISPFPGLTGQVLVEGRVLRLAVLRCRNPSQRNAHNKRGEQSARSEAEGTRMEGWEVKHV